MVSAVAFGVAVAGADGRAGMALLKVDKDFELGALAARIKALPRHARPLFLRFAEEIETTETFKLKRRLYLEQGYNPARTADRLYLFNAKIDRYVALDAETYAAIQARTIVL